MLNAIIHILTRCDIKYYNNYVCNKNLFKLDSQIKQNYFFLNYFFLCVFDCELCLKYLVL